MFDSVLVLDPDGVGMFRTSLRHALWYLENNLAEKIDETTYKLLFKPGGPGHRGDPFYLSERKNICVVCGTSENLNRHHMVPRCYRRYFPDMHQRRSRVAYGGDKSKDKGSRHWFYDIMALCKPCHRAYEPKAYVLKEKLADEVGITMGGLWNINGKRVNQRVASSIRTLIKHHDEIPNTEDGKIKLWRAVHECLPNINTIKDLEVFYESVNRYPDIQPSKKVVETLETDRDFDDFYIMWRRHFIETMNPKHMPEHWDADRRVCEEPNDPYKK